ncbi:coxsackievirus and adenovirus receptor homolog isoform X2 [Acanthopagrus latus]|uniref:coxsackievirus and adenovirus receptor homolog isoform X2 n=2 Tax=Acanthopagrus latus TaxID=8177 RepID=UPI00187C4030|nr:coxsackievirus and adenovirus receptor homolog isoform X2 [Acanthopagrus latus]
MKALSATQKVSQKLQPIPKHISLILKPRCSHLPTPMSSRNLPTKFGLWPVLGILFLFTTRPTPALEIISHIKHYYGVLDSAVTLNCEFAVASENCQPREIEWSIVPPNRAEDDKLIIHYTGGQIYNHLYDPLKGRLHFTSPEPQNGDASISITDLKPEDTGSYQCKVRCLPELGLKIFILTVMERPSKPKCYIDSQPVANQDLRLRCRSSKGSPPLTYRWSKQSGNRMLPHGAFVDRTGGDLYLDKVTEHDSGSYLCTVESLVGVQDCEVILSFTAPPTVNYRHVAVGVGVTVTVLIIIAIIAATCYCRKKNDEEFSNEILQDELPPRTWLAKNHESVVSWPLESCRGSAQKEKSEEAGSIAHGVTVHDEAMHKPMKKDVSETDVCHSDGERQIQSTNLMMRHEKDEELCFSQKDNSEFGSSEHNATSRGEAVEQKAKSEIGSGDNHVMAHGEAMPKEE